MAEGSGTNNAAIWVALITVFGSLLTALIVNVDKWMPRTDKAQAIPSAAATPAQPDPSLPAAAPAPGGTQTLNAAAVSPPPAAPAAEPARPVPARSAGPVDLNGVWRDDDGSRYHFEQKGSKYELTQTAINGDLIMFSRGEIAGQELSHSFEALTGEKGSCSGHINEAGNKITGTCLVNGEGGSTFAIKR
jgi:hypothetical protein